MSARWCCILVTLLALSSAACSSPPQPPTPSDRDARAGLIYAEQHCAACHAIGRGAAVSPVSLAPAFQTVADTPGMTAIALRVWLRTPHEAMPDFIVPEAAIDDLAAYLASLKMQD